MPREYVRTGWWMYCPMPANSTTSGTSALISCSLNPMMRPPTSTFWVPVKSAWNPVPSSRSEETRPSVRTAPTEGVVVPVMIFKSVLLPAPFRPTMPTDSPGPSEKETSRRAQRST